MPFFSKKCRLIFLLIWSIQLTALPTTCRVLVSRYFWPEYVCVPSLGWLIEVFNFWAKNIFNNRPCGSIETKISFVNFNNISLCVVYTYQRVKYRKENNTIGFFFAKFMKYIQRKFILLPICEVYPKKCNTKIYM